ncbi:MAG: hypothetical protein N2691_03370 [Patescibacteria group bacterium]|nr:hypothetical protein [Patescibacteria group bacterium]
MPPTLRDTIRYIIVYMAILLSLVLVGFYLLASFLKLLLSRKR